MSFKKKLRNTAVPFPGYIPRPPVVNPMYYVFSYTHTYDKYIL